MTPELVERVDAWISANIALLEPESGFREAMAFNLRYGWIDARGTWLGLIASDQSEAEIRVAAAAMRGILLELVRWAWDDGTLHVEPHPSGAWGIYTLMSEQGIGGARTLLIPSGSSEDEALVAALEAAPRPPQIGGAS